MLIRLVFELLSKVRIGEEFIIAKDGRRIVKEKLSYSYNKNGIMIDCEDHKECQINNSMKDYKKVCAILDQYYNDRRKQTLNS